MLEQMALLMLLSPLAFGVAAFSMFLQPGNLNWREVSFPELD